jgi:hypothetical protein
MDTYNQTALRLLFEIGIFHKSLPTRLMMNLVRTCKWFHERAQPLIRKRELTLCRLRRPFRRIVSDANGYMRRVLPTSELEEELWYVIILDINSPFPAPGEYPGISFTLTNIWLRADRRLECVVNIGINGVTRTIRSDDYITIGPDDYAVNLNLMRNPRWVPRPDYDLARTGLCADVEQNGPHSDSSIYLYDFSHVILFYRTHSS